MSIGYDSALSAGLDNLRRIKDAKVFTKCQILAIDLNSFILYYLDSAPCLSNVFFKNLILLDWIYNFLSITFVRKYILFSYRLMGIFVKVKFKIFRFQLMRNIFEKIQVFFSILELGFIYISY